MSVAGLLAHYWARRNQQALKTNRFRLLWLTAGLLTLSTFGKAQSPIRDLDNEARNAFREGCTASQLTPGFARCNQPALSPGKRLAIRYVSATCRTPGAVRNPTIMFVGRMESVGSPSTGPVLIPTRVNAARPFYLLAQPVFLHTDSPPQVIVTWEGEDSLECIANTFGYLVDKPE
jgi:hypothetical protein